MTLLRTTALRSAHAPVASTSTTPVPVRGSPARSQPAAADSQLCELRRQWKWAAFSQFFYTFSALIALNDVTLVDIEEDLVNSTMVVLPRLMQRLLIALSHDRKISGDNWQTALRRQYLRRDPHANPIGIEPVVSRHSRATTVDTEVKLEQQDEPFEADTIVNGEVGYKGSLAEETTSSPAASMPDAMKTEFDLVSSERRPSEEEVPRSDHLSLKDEDSKEGFQVKDWTELSMLEKLGSIHTVIEWHFQSPLRLRSIMRSDDESASWRMEPIGYDAKRNAYWLIGPDRLWIQRIPPKLPKKAQKRKAANSNPSRRTKAPRLSQKEDTDSAIQLSPHRISKLKRVQVDRTDERNDRTIGDLGTPLRLPRGTRKVAEAEQPETASPRARAAKTRANVKLDLQAKHLAAVKAELLSYSRQASPRKNASLAHRVIGTRASRRLRGVDGDDDDEWQQIPPEWLSGTEDSDVKETTQPSRSSGKIRIPPRLQTDINNTANSSGHRKSAKKTCMSSDEESALTDLSDLESPCDGDDRAAEHRSSNDEVPHKLSEVVAQIGTLQKDGAETDQQWPPSDFVEWETICVSLQEWECISQRFEKATHYFEKALYRCLANEIAPTVIEMLRELEVQRAKEEALLNRKRSSRIAIRESEKEMARLAALKQAEDDEKMARARRLEVRAKREEEERLKREQAREQRRREREERELVRSHRLEEAQRQRKAHSVTMEVNVVDNDVLPTKMDETIPGGTPEPTSEKLKYPKRLHAKSARKKAARWEEWVLDCEVCGSKGVNKDEDVPLMSCGKCNKWQHIVCHDEVDKRAGKPLRNWDLVDFFCRHCLESRSKARTIQKNEDEQKKAVRAAKATTGDLASLARQSQSDTDHAQVPGAATGTETFRTGRPHPLSYVASPILYPDGHLSQAAGNNIIPAASKRTLPHQSQTSVTFAHYQPLEQGFSQHPMAHHRQLQTYGLSHPTLAQPATAYPVQIKSPTWAAQSSGDVAYPALNGHSAYTAPSASIAYHAHSTQLYPSQPYTPQSYGMIPNGSLPKRSPAPAVSLSSYPQVYSQPQQPPQ